MLFREIISIYCENDTKHNKAGNFNGFHLGVLDHKNNGKITNKMHSKLYFYILC
jgi:hypothetical protein